MDTPVTESWYGPAHQHCSVVHQMMLLVAAATPKASYLPPMQPWHLLCDHTVPTYTVTRQQATTLTAELGWQPLCMSVSFVLIITNTTN